MVRRRFRAFLFSATVLLFLLYRVARNSWDDSPQGLYTPFAHTSLHDYQNQSPAEQPHPDQSSHSGDKDTLRPGAGSGGPDGLAETGVTPQDKGSIAPAKDHQEAIQAEDHQEAIPAKDRQEIVPAEATPDPTPAKAHHEVLPTDTGDSLVKIPEKDRQKTDDGDGQTPQVPHVEPLVVQATAPTKTSPYNSQGIHIHVPDRVHWKPVREHFPLPRGSVRPLPNISDSTKIPQVQFDFKEPESGAAKTERVERLKSVQEEIKRAWSGYKAHAWLHDELSPVSGGHRDPFCGWAATLIDGLDTLWLAGLRDEFHEAAHAVKEIDFTWSTQDSIPVFETTIRYLGGLLGALDVSGGLDGDYAFLLDKAVELAEILMGIFDTPNRMPVLYYRWKPEFASQPHQAGLVGMAELGTLSLEFTRLAQLTRKSKYYDAVDRITDALVDMQEAGTVIPGLFPEQLDASGCSRDPSSNHLATSRKAQEQMKSPELSKPAVGYSTDTVAAEKSKDGALQRRDGLIAAKASEPPPPRQIPMPQVPSTNLRGNSGPLAADGSTSQWDCVPQGLVPSTPTSQQFHIGGSQDSAYEYFQKQHILLGGAEDKYRKLHVDSIKAIDEWLLYRPMVENDPDILFARRISTNGDLEKDRRMSFVVDHLSCFIGGMYAMGGKLFQREGDLEKAARLTDGCVWAYGVTASGIMPESAHVVPCPSLDKCEFNKTAWWAELDPSMAWREERVAEWDAEWGAPPSSQITWEDEKPEDTGSAGNEDERDEVNSVDSEKDMNHTTDKSEDEDEDVDVDEPGSELPQALKDRIGWDQGSQKPNSRSLLARSAGQVEDTSSGKKAPRQLNSVLEANRLPQLPPDDAPKNKPPRPQTHEEYVKERLQTQNIPPGFTALNDARYILRPEAIESVFYMYRITGDTSWQDKGWKMFEATMEATRTSVAHSAVDDVFKPKPGFKDEMESFWLAETLKYYYLLFSEPDLASLDEWVFNTEAHPFRRP